MTIKNKNKLFWFFSIPTMYTVISISSASQPYIPSEGYLDFLKYIVFPISVLAFYYLAFFQRQEATGKTRFQKRLEDTTKNFTKMKATFTKFKNYIIGIITVPIICIILLFMTQWYPAWPVKYLAETQVTFKATVIKLGNIRKTQQIKIYLKDISTGREFSLHWDTSFHAEINVNDIVELTAKKHWLGLYIERFKVI